MKEKKIRRKCFPYSGSLNSGQPEDVPVLVPWKCDSYLFAGVIVWRTLSGGRCLVALTVIERVFIRGRPEAGESNARMEAALAVMCSDVEECHEL